MSYTQLIFPKERRRASRFLRTIRAVWRDTSALYREFRRPLLILLLVLFPGGFLYRALMISSGAAAADIPAPIDMPYVILTMMVLDPAVPLPREPYLIAFWYLMPALAVYIIGRGASDFVRLFFDRSGRRDAWEEAVASTYRNHIIVLGVGHVGIKVIRTLSEMGFDVVAIDNTLDAKKFAHLAEINVPAIPGDGREVDVLEKAGLPHAQAFIVCTSNELVNLEAVMRARDMNSDIRIVARSWDASFAAQLKRFIGVQAVLSASTLAAPVFAGLAVGIEITQTLNINGQEFSMIRLTVEPNSFLDGHTIIDLQKRHNMDIVLHGCGDVIDVHPADHVMVRAGDTLVIFARHSDIINIVARNRPNRVRPR